MDSSIITCDCGSKLRIPEGKPTRTLRCPKCKTLLAITANSTVLKTTTLSDGQQSICPICQTQMSTEEACVVCPSCDQTHHQECWSEVGGCGTYGCEESPAVEESETIATGPLTAWGDTKKCPACGEEIKSIALRCRYCSTEFDSVDPLSVADLRKQAKVSEELEALKKMVIAIFVLSLLGCLAPLMAIVSMAYLLPKREKLAKCGPLFVIMGRTAIVLSAIYSVLLIVFLLFGEL